MLARAAANRASMHATQPARYAKAQHAAMAESGDPTLPSRLTRTSTSRNQGSATAKPMADATTPKRERSLAAGRRDRGRVGVDAMSHRRTSDSTAWAAR